VGERKTVTSGRLWPEAGWLAVGAAGVAGVAQAAKRLAKARKRITGFMGSPGFGER